MQKATAKEIREGLKPIREGIENLPQAITFPPTQPLGEASGKEKPLNLGETAEEYLRTPPLTHDKKFGIRKIKHRYYIGNKQVTFDDNDIFVDNEVFEGTPGLWELIMTERPKFCVDEDYDNYARLMVKTNALYQNYDPDNPNPRSGRGDKWKFVRDIWFNREKYKEEDPLKRKFLRESQKEKKEYERVFDPDQYIYPSNYPVGKGVVVMSSDPNALLERLDLLLASQKAGYTNVRNELVSICDELKRQGVLDTRSYKNLNSIIKK